MKYVLWTVLILSLLAGCVFFKTGTNTAKIPVYLTDNPAFNIEKLLVKISKAEYHYSLDEEEYTATATLAENEFDLLSLAGTEVQFLEMKLPEGAKLEWIRLYIDAATAVTNDSTETVVVPSRKIKIIKPIIVQSGDSIVLDFDVARSLKITSTGNNKKYLLRPIIVPYHHRERNEYGFGEGEKHRYEVEGRLKETLSGTPCLVALFEGETCSGTLVNLEITDDHFDFEDLKEATYTVCVYTDFELPEGFTNTDEELEIDEDDIENANDEISIPETPFASETFYLNDSTITYILDSNLIELTLGD
jgi:hypothetical protein